MLESSDFPCYCLFLQEVPGEGTLGTSFLTNGFALTNGDKPAILTLKYYTILWGYFNPDRKWEGSVLRASAMMRKAISVLAVLALFLCFLPQQAHAVLVPEFQEQKEHEPLSEEERKANILKIAGFLRYELALPDSAIAAVLANMDRESAFDPRAIDETGTFFGLCQWSRTRWLDCFCFCRQNGLDRLTVEGQLAFLRYELEGEYDWILTEYLLDAEDSEDGAQEAQYYFCELFEAPTDLDWEQVRRSKLVAEVYWPMMLDEKLVLPEPAVQDPKAPVHLPD